MDKYKIPSLGRHVPLGTLYNAQTDSFSTQQIFESGLHDAIFIESPSSRAGIEQDHYNEETYSSKFKLTRTPPQLAASMLAGMAQPKVYGGYLMERPQTSTHNRRALRQTITSVEQKLDFTSEAMKQRLGDHADDLGRATHIVVEIAWGTESIVTLSAKDNQGVESSPFENVIDACLRCLKSSCSNPSREESTTEMTAFDEQLDLIVYGDMLQDKGPLQGTFNTVLKFLSSMPRYLAQDRKGRPLMYTLLPIGILGYILPGIAIGSVVKLQQPSTEGLENIIHTFDTLAQATALAARHERYITTHQSFVPSTHIHEIQSLQHTAHATFDVFHAEYSKLLYKVRVGREDVAQLTRLIAGINSGKDLFQQVVRKTSRFNDLLSFLVIAVRRGAVYHGYNGIPFDPTALREFRDAYVFNFNEQLSHEKEMWSGMTTLTMNLLGESGRGAYVALLDHDGLNEALSTPSITRYRGGRVAVKDLWKQHQLLANHSVVRFDRTKLYLPDTHGKSVHRRPVKMPCGQAGCDPKLRHNWICLHCTVNVEYSPDRNFSCDCGQWYFAMSEFRCSSPTHGPAFSKYGDMELLQRILQNLEPYREINILILGESGVGKSTFINAFVNYIYFSELKQALDSNELHFLIPFSFATQIPDKNDPTGRIIQEIVSFGSSADEHDGSKGQSATQKTQVYAVTFGSTIVRLIDTPGVGDVRGAEQDNRNMADILSVLRGYTYVHGVLVLLKPNNCRLGVMFKFCIKELLTHLHQSAAQNIAFGFTNTRGSNYQPGDTFKPLEVLLKDFNSANIGLFKSTVYCFDSESFRYLAGRHRHINIGDQSDYERSWQQSANEARRLLAHFQSLQPHQVKSTMSLNETRNVIAQLTKPMAEIAQEIKSSIAVSEGHARELQSKKLSRKDLEKRLHIPKHTLRAERVDDPRTVCANAACTETRKSGTGQGYDGMEQHKTIYKTICHKHCSRPNVQEDMVADPGLMACHCIIQSGPEAGTCRRCSHSWQEHLHIRYELLPDTTIVTDSFVEQELRQNSSSTQVQEKLLQSKVRAIKAFNREHEAIKQATSKFTLFLRHNSITPYNDATVEYLDFLIKDEKSKVQVGAEPRRLEELERYRAEHLQMVHVLTQNVEHGRTQVPDEAGMNRLISKLFDLPHFGGSLRQIREVIEDARTASFREKPYRVGGYNVTTWAYALMPKNIEANYTRQIVRKELRKPSTFAPEIINLPPSGYHQPSMTRAIEPKYSRQTWHNQQRQPSTVAQESASFTLGGHYQPATQTLPDHPVSAGPIEYDAPLQTGYTELDKETHISQKVPPRLQQTETNSSGIRRRLSKISPWSK